MWADFFWLFKTAFFKGREENQTWWAFDCGRVERNPRILPVCPEKTSVDARHRAKFDSNGREVVQWCSRIMVFSPQQLPAPGGGLFGGVPHIATSSFSVFGRCTEDETQKTDEPKRSTIKFFPKRGGEAPLLGCHGKLKRALRKVSTFTEAGGGFGAGL